MLSQKSHRGRIHRYRFSARFDDLISAERPVYRAGRVAAIDLLALRPGHRVLDIGRGTVPSADSTVSDFSGVDPARLR
ncbi:MAG: hypothetical protein WEB51_05835 [Mycobacterium sp.]